VIEYWPVAPRPQSLRLKPPQTVRKMSLCSTQDSDENLRSAQERRKLHKPCLAELKLQEQALRTLLAQLYKGPQVLSTRWLLQPWRGRLSSCYGVVQTIATSEHWNQGRPTH